jgi:hypothetical protein
VTMHGDAEVVDFEQGAPSHRVILLALPA